MNSTLDLMRKRIAHTQKKQEEDYEKELRLRLARRGINPRLVGAVSAEAANTPTSSTLGNKEV